MKISGKFVFPLKIQILSALFMVFGPAFSQTCTGTIVRPSITISTNSTRVCLGSTVLFVATAINCGANPSYQWKVNGLNVGTNSDTLAINNLQNGDNVNCTVTADPEFACASPRTSSSFGISIQVISSSQPSISIVAATNDFCPGLSLEIVAQVQNGDPLGHYQWEWNGAPAGPDSSIFTNAGYQNGDSVYCLYSDSSSCSPVPTKSNILVIEVKTLPLVSTSPVDTLVQAGSSIELNGIVNQDSVSNYEWEPIGSVSSPHSFSTLTTPVESATTYYFNVSTTDGCQVTKTVTIGLLYTFAMPTAFTPNGDGINDIYRIPPRTNLILQEFDVFNRWGDRVFTTQNISTGWDGTWKGIKQDVGIYFYFIRGQTDQAQVISRGSLILIR